MRVKAHTWGTKKRFIDPCPLLAQVQGGCIPHSYGYLGPWDQYLVGCRVKGEEALYAVSNHP